MDEVGFELSSSRGVREVGSRSASSKSQSSLADTVHVTVAAAISTVDAPVPPFFQLDSTVPGVPKGMFYSVVSTSMGIYCEF